MKLAELFSSAIAKVANKTYCTKIDHYDKTGHSKAGIVSYRYACYVNDMNDEQVENVRKIIAEQYTGPFTLHLLDGGYRTNLKLCLTVKLPVPYFLKGATKGTSQYGVQSNGMFIHNFILSGPTYGSSYESNQLRHAQLINQLLEAGYRQDSEHMFSKATQLSN